MQFFLLIRTHYSPQPLGNNVNVLSEMYCTLSSFRNEAIDKENLRIRVNQSQEAVSRKQHASEDAEHVAFPQTVKEGDFCLGLYSQETVCVVRTSTMKCLEEHSKRSRKILKSLKNAVIL